MSRYRALFVGAFRPIAAAVVARWIAAGNEVAEFWYSGRQLHGQRRRDRRLGWFAPQWSVSAQAREHDFPLVEVPRLATWRDAIPRAAAAGADVLISVYFANIVPPEMLALFPGRAVNFHPAPLPRHRGPNPIAAMALDRTIRTDGAMTLHAMSERLDEGDVIAQTRVPFPPEQDLFDYHLGLARAAAKMTANELPGYLEGRFTATPQDPALASYHRPTSIDMRLSPSQSSEEIRWRCETLALQSPLVMEGMGRLRAAGFRGILGRPSGRPPRIGPWAIDFDAADARVRVARSQPLFRLGRQLRQLARYMKTPAR